jgi:hypothetical protein
MFKKKKKLALSRETLDTLTRGGLGKAAGGLSRNQVCSNWPNCNCTFDETGCGGGGGGTCGVTGCVSCPI